jgi:hypothetical protein
MQSRRPWRFYRIISLILLAAACAIAPLRAQTAPQDFEDDDEKSASTLSLSVTLSENGKTVVAAYAFTHSTPADLKPTLESALHCQLETKVKNPIGSYFGSCPLRV